MTVANKSKQAISVLVKDIAKKENVPYDAAYDIFNSLSQKKRRKLLETTTKEGSSYVGQNK